MSKIKKITSYVLLLVFCVLSFVQTAPIVIAQGGVVDVTATIDETVSCSAPTATSTFGTLTLNTVTTATPNSTSTVSCNSATGCNFSVISTNAGLVRSGGGYTITSATADLDVVDEGYGIQGSISGGSGATFSVSSPFDGATNNVGAVATTSQEIATASGPTDSRLVTVTYKTKAYALTSSGSYSDELTYGCTAN